MQKISKKEFQDGTYYLKDYLAKKNQFNDRVLFFVGADVFISEEGKWIYLVDNSDKTKCKYYRDDSEVINRLHAALLRLYVMDIGIMRSFSTSSNVLYTSIEESEFIYGPITFSFKLLQELHNYILKARMTYSPK